MTDQTILQRVTQIVGPSNILTGTDMDPFVTDWRDRYHGRALCVARPGNVQEVAALMQLSAREGIPVVPQGGNTGLCGAATPDDSGQAMVIRLDRMNRILAISALDSMIRVEAGCVLQTLQETARRHGLYFPLSLGAEGSCQIGGNIATNAGGTSVLRYGAMRDLVLGLEVVLPDGTICDWLSPMRKNTTGYDLKQLFIGAEGTLGLITAASLKVFAAPRQCVTCMLTLDTVEQALDIFARLRATLGERISSFEIMNKTQVDVVLQYTQGNTYPFATVAPWSLLIEVTDTLPGTDLLPCVEDALAACMENDLMTDAVITASEAQAQALWRLRHSVSEGNKTAGISVAHDTAVPLSRQADFARLTQERLRAAFPHDPMPMLGHLGDGNIHAVVILNREEYADDDQRKAAIRQINDIVDDVTLSLGGVISAEHGVGQGNVRRLLAGRGENDVRMMQKIKMALDPDWRMNAGKLFAPPTDGIS
ncbi:FAD-binding oxidoreductase [Komagataeibacter swingsii]|uniref:FAD-binding oxidoreductase n=1 Tax=Komagataeibacter swingsii TaxID=215220 RepID=UPI001FC9A72F|nr:FAD-binding oxidoreductase [Komagataeibacter swingsii]